MLPLLLITTVSARTVEVGDQLAARSFLNWRQEHPLIAATVPLPGETTVPLPGDGQTRDVPEEYSKADKLATAGVYTFGIGTGLTVVGVVVVVGGALQGLAGDNNGLGVSLAGLTLVGIGGGAVLVGEGLILDGSLRAAYAMRDGGLDVPVWAGWTAVGLHAAAFLLQTAEVAQLATNGNSSLAVAVGSLPGLLSTTAIVLSFTQYQISHHAGSVWRYHTMNQPHFMPMAGRAGDATVVGFSASW